MTMKNKNIKSNYRIFKDDEGREFHINEEKLLQELQKHQSMREMSRKLILRSIRSAVVV